ncbi:MAG TPA: hypothetical protein PLV87_16115, partial [Opitutaceae bacterium]|nr:hypothetical protein [Opitutaceae bacterium]
MPILRLALRTLLLIAVAPLVILAQRTPDYEQPPISYSASAAADAAARLQEKIDSGALHLEGGERQVLRGLLESLHVPVDSQLLVFTKTSLQRG